MQYTEFTCLFGLRLESPEIQAVLAGSPAYQVRKPSDGSQYLISYEGGFDLLFEDRDYKRHQNQNRTLCCVFFFAEGVDGHQKFNGELPFGFEMTDDRAVLLDKRTPDRSWVIGKGRVPISEPSPDSDTWQSKQDFNISADYSSGKLRLFQISPFVILDENNEWKAPATWQDFALSGQKLEAIKSYQQEANVSMAEAKKIIDEFLENTKNST